MPAEKFYVSGQVEDDGRDPDLTVAWGHEPPRVLINGLTFATPGDCSSLSRLIGSLIRAREVMQPTELTYTTLEHEPRR